MHFLLGAPKSGTTWLSDAISQHPELCVSNPKEPHIFSSHKGTFARDHSEPDVRKYEKYFDGSGMRIDCSAHTLFCPLAPVRIAKNYPDAKFIICLREPIDRVESHWKMILDTREDKIHGFNWERFMDAWNDEKMKECSKYGEALERWLEVFSLDRFLIIGSSRMKEEPFGVLSQVESHLSISNFEYDLDLIKNSNIGSGRRSVNSFGYFLKLIISLIPKRVKDPFIRWITRRNIDVYQFRFLSSPNRNNFREVNLEERKLVSEDLKADIELLERQLGIKSESLKW